VDNAYTTIGISGGLAAPDGQFGGKPNFERAGFAKLGYMFQLDYNYALIGNIGATSSVAYFNNPIDDVLFFNQRVKPVLGGDFNTANFDAENWQSFAFSIGPSLSFPEEIAVLELKLMLGGIYTLPATINYNDVESFYQFERQESFTLGADIRAGIHLRLADPFRLTGELRYFASAPEFDYAVQSASGFTSQSETFTRQQRVNFFTLSVGIAYEL